MNRRNVAALNKGRFASAGRRGLGRAGGFSHGNAFANANWGGRGFGNRGYRGFFAGGVFWPYFFGDYFSYAFWPYDYWDTFWGWGPDLLLWNAFWPGYDYPYYDYGYGYYNAGYPGGAAYAGDIYRGYGLRRAAAPQRLASVSPQAAAASCSGFAPGVESLPLQRIEAVLQPTPSQHQALDELRQAMEKAANVLGGACPSQAPGTPVARLDVMEQRLQAMQQAADIIRGPLDRLYGELSPTQRQRLDAAVAQAQPNVTGRKFDVAKLCSSQVGFVNVPADDIARTVKLDDRQSQDLDQLKQASAKAADILRNSCPANVPETLDARLDAAQQRIGALIQAIDTIKPAAGTFFASLSSGQKTALDSQAPNVRTARR